MFGIEIEIEIEIEEEEELVIFGEWGLEKFRFSIRKGDRWECY